MAGAVIYRNNPDDMSFDVYSYGPSILTSGDNFNQAIEAFQDALREYGQMQFKGGEYIERQVVDGLYLRYPTRTHSNDIEFMRATLQSNAAAFQKEFGDYVTGTGDVTVLYATGKTKIGTLFDQVSNREAIIIGVPIRLADGRYAVRTDVLIGTNSGASIAGSPTLKQLGLNRRSTVRDLWNVTEPSQDDPSTSIGDGGIQVHRQLVLA